MRNKRKQEKAGGQHHLRRFPLCIFAHVRVVQCHGRLRIILLGRLSIPRHDRRLARALPCKDACGTETGRQHQGIVNACKATIRRIEFVVSAVHSKTTREEDERGEAWQKQGGDCDTCEPTKMAVGSTASLAARRVWPSTRVMTSSCSSLALFASMLKPAEFERQPSHHHTLVFKISLCKEKQILATTPHAKVTPCHGGRHE
jgi:hypothetical protein